jgi:hypothetical protein
MEIGFPHIPVGSTFYLLDVAIFNASNEPLTVLGAHVSFGDTAVTDLGHQTYFSATGVPLQWRRGPSAPGLNPVKLSPRPLVGVTIAPHHSVVDDRFSMGRYRLNRPGRYQARGLTVTYRQGGRTFQETVAIHYDVSSK